MLELLSCYPSRSANLEQLRALRLFYPPAGAAAPDSLAGGHEVCVRAAADLLKVHQHVQLIRLKIFP